MRLPRPPSRRRLSAALALLGVLAGVAFLVAPVETAFAGDPLLRLQAFGSPDASAEATTGVDCGSPLANLSRHDGGLSLYTLARNQACQAAASRRVASAVAVIGVLGVLGAIGLTGGRTRQEAA